MNPLRYRGYVYDTETGFYYLQSRYYDPEIGRFLNADAYTSTGQGVLGNNMFVYCGNNPASRCDTAGTIEQKCYQETSYINFPMILKGAGGGNSGEEVLSTVVAYGLTCVAAYYCCVTVCTTTQELVNATQSSLSAEGYTVYFLSSKNDTSKTIIYVGRVLTRNFDARMAYHRSKGRQLVYCITNLTYEECRAIEQGGMIYYHTINRNNESMNKIRGIGPNNKNRAQYFSALSALVNSGMYPKNALIPISYWENLSEEVWLNGSL